jgi:nucleoid-associated protein YgaU
VAPLPGWLPDRPPPVISPHDARLLAPVLRPTSAASDTLTVRRGDTLWSIAAAHLGPGATDAEIAAEWPRWYEANTAVIGDDPDVIVAGQQLQAPHAEVFR